MSIQAMTAESVVPPKVSPHAKFKMALKSKEVQRQYPNNTNERENLWTTYSLDKQDWQFSIS
jgi:hypothetical protein